MIEGNSGYATGARDHPAVSDVDASRPAFNECGLFRFTSHQTRSRLSTSFYPSAACRSCGAATRARWKPTVARSAAPLISRRPAAPPLACSCTGHASEALACPVHGRTLALRRWSLAPSSTLHRIADECGGGWNLFSFKDPAD